MNRRDFLKASAVLPLMSAFPVQSLAANNQKQRSRIVVLVELKGGNDSFNTLIPYKDDAYYRLRPKLAIPRKQLIRLQDGMGMHSALKPLHSLWRNDELAWIQGIGFRGQGKSHFSSIDVWNSASQQRQHQHNGWLSQIFPHSVSVKGVAIDEQLGPLAGSFYGINLRQPEAFIRDTHQLSPLPGTDGHPLLSHLVNVQHRVTQAGRHLEQRLQNNQVLRRAFPGDDFGESLSVVARMILSGFDMPVYKVGLGNFDTHVSQLNKHQWLLNELSQGLAAFSRVMKEHRRWDDVIVVTYSEFGRAAGENYSMGTDHGSAAAHMVLGGGVRGGKIYGKHPNLEALHAGQADFNVDFRAIYATLAKHWWQRHSPWNIAPVPFIA